MDQNTDTKDMDVVTTEPSDKVINENGNEKGPGDTGLKEKDREGEPGGEPSNQDASGVDKDDAGYDTNANGEAENVDPNVNESIEEEKLGDDGGEGAKSDEDNEDDPFAGLDDVATMDLYNIGNYTFGKKDTESKSKLLKEMSGRALSNVLRLDYERRGLRRSVRAVILVHEHNFAHVLLLQRHDGKGEFSLPGGRLRAGEDFEQGLLRKLSAKLCTGDTHAASASIEGSDPPKDIANDIEEGKPTLEVGDKLGKWYAIDFSRRYYPYIPAHVTKVKEEVHVYSVLLPSKFVFAVPKNLQLVAVPLCDIHSNTTMSGLKNAKFEATV